MSENKDNYEERDYNFLNRKDYNSIYKKVLWPINHGIYDFDDKNLKKELCLIVTNIPVEWSKYDVVWFFREYFYRLAINKNIFFPLIEHVYLLKNQPSAILACHDGISRETIESLSHFILKNMKNKKKIHLNIEPYYKKNNDEQKKKDKHDIHEDKYDKNEKYGEDELDTHNNKKTGMQDENNVISKMRKISITPPRDNGMEWPDDLDLRNCYNIEMRKKLCVFGRYKPLHWGVKEMSKFLKYYFESLKRDHENFEIPEICDMWADKGTHLVTLACKNEISRFNMLLIRACYLNDEDAKYNMKNSLRVWIEFEKWTSYKNTVNKNFKNYKVGKNDNNKYSSSIHDHMIDKNHRRKFSQKPYYDDFQRYKASYIKTSNINSFKPYNHNNFPHKDYKYRRNNDYSRNIQNNRSPSPYYSKYKKNYSKSLSSENYRMKKIKRSKSFEERNSRVTNMDYISSQNMTQHNKKFSHSYSRNS
ncbi:conserved Plasmodium protein, unknown function [Plasmodium sp. gorilla clade G1]|nr:conserved Plasmodium protein, unknown function [Plasmodium sp. gorilla clade G1]